MQVVKRAFLCILPLLLGHTLIGQVPKLSDNAQFSVLTCAGDPSVLYYSFGHTAFRVQDSINGIDVVYNYGTFDFGQPNFYLNFTKGRLLYTLSRRSFSSFLQDYKLDKRWVRQQVLNLGPEETNEVFQFLEWNFLPDNRDYLYDPLFDNCSTVLAKILAQNFGDAILYVQPNDESLDAEKSTSPTFRQLVRSHMATNSWGSFGIDLAFGAVVDRAVSLRERLFLPYQAMYQVRVAKKEGQPLLRNEEVILDYTPKNPSHPFFTSPLFVLSILFCAVLLSTYAEVKRKRRNGKLDFWVLLISGLAGSFLLFLWFGTDHVYTKNNWNILWLLPTNALAAFIIPKKKNIAPWGKLYLCIALLLLVFTLALWVFKIQVFSPLVLLAMGILGARYVILLKR